MHVPTRGKLFRQHVNVFATLVLELKYLNAAQQALCDAGKWGQESGNAGTLRESAIRVGRFGRPVTLRRNPDQPLPKSPAFSGILN
jgi:hypothetical protein